VDIRLVFAFHSGDIKAIVFKRRGGFKVVVVCTLHVCPWAVDPSEENVNDFTINFCGTTEPRS
jgi:hypothetical protein